MTCYIESAPEIPSSHTRRTAVTTAKSAPAATTFQDAFWGDQWWMALRDASRLDSILETIVLPAVPNAVGTRKELDELLAKQASSEREKRRPDIIAQDAAWPTYFAQILFGDPPGNVKTNALITAAVVWSRAPIMAMKFKYKRPRPTQLEPRIIPIISIPRHPAYPSGHSTQTHLAAHVSAAITGQTAIRDAFLEFADYVAENREYAGVHYRSDSIGGVQLAAALAPHFLEQFKDEADEARSEWG